MTVLVSHRPIVAARVYAGQWIIDCPMCCGAQVVALGDRCVDCDTRLDVIWPSDEMRHGIERVLGLRPVTHTRNWTPGESLHDLLAENVEHRIGPTEEGQLIEIIGDTVTRDSLPPATPRQQIGA